MATSRYQPEVHRPSTKEEVQQISQDLHLNCSTDMLQALTDKTNEVLKSLQVIDNLVDFLPETKYPRTPGWKPEPGEPRCDNAWAWRCDVQGAPSGKLFGKTFAIKDNVAVAGVPMSNGSHVLQGYTPEYDATVVTRILDAGGRILGKANCDDFCVSGMGFASPDGFIHFPDKPNVTVGGSSGGSGVLVATGQVDMAIAGDQGGSIRIPAASSGIVGLKPTFGLVPYTGCISIEALVDHVGPITKNVHDCALFLEVIAGSDGLDGRQLTNTDVPEYSKLLEVDVKGKKLGLLKEGFDSCVDETKSAVKSFLSTVGKAGLSTIDVSAPLHTHGLDIFVGVCLQGALSGTYSDGTCCQHVKGFFSTSVEKAVRQGLQSSANLFSPGAQHFNVAGEFIRRRYGNHYYTKARNLTIKLTQEYDKALETCDVLVMPTLTHTAKEFVTNKDTAAQSHFAYLDQSIDMVANTCPSDLSGHPALTLPLGPMADGSVDALMIVGRKFDELTVLQVARALEKIIPAREGLH